MSINTPEFRELMCNLGYWVDEDDAESDECARILIAHIDSKIAAPADRDARLTVDVVTGVMDQFGFLQGVNEHHTQELCEALESALKSMERAADAKGDAA